MSMPNRFCVIERRLDIIEERLDIENSETDLNKQVLPKKDLDVLNSEAEVIDEN